MKNSIKPKKARNQIGVQNRADSPNFLNQGHRIFSLDGTSDFQTSVIKETLETFPDEPIRQDTLTSPSTHE